LTSAGAPPQTPQGELTALPRNPLAGFKGPTSKGRGKDKGGAWREGKGKEGE